MSILIKGMEMPKRCTECRLSTVYSFNDRPLCDVLVEYMSYGEWETKRLDNCPLVPVPPHGRLIDADALYENCALDHGYEVMATTTRINEYMQLKIDRAPTIIPASEEEMK